MRLVRGKPLGVEMALPGFSLVAALARWAMVDVTLSIAEDKM